MDYLGNQDVVTFTGSAETGMKLRSHEKINNFSVPFNMEADSLNSCVLGPNVEPGTADFDIFIKEVAKEMTVKQVKNVPLFAVRSFPPIELKRLKKL